MRSPLRVEPVEVLAPPLGPNAIGAALGLLGDEWTLLIVRYAFTGVRRYGDWQRALGISDSVLSARLSALGDAGVLVRAPYGDKPTRFEYLLTRSGRDLWALLLSIWAWERQWVSGQDDLLPVMRHTSCSSAFTPVLSCRRCTEPVEANDVAITLGPSGAMARSVPVGRNRRRAGERTGAGRAGPGPSVFQRASGPGLFADTMALMGSRWSAALLGSAFLGARRFSEFEARLGAPPTIVAERLRTFLALGVLETHPAPGRTDRAEYVLSPKGLGFYPVVSCFIAWGERWLPAPDGPALVGAHRGCGALFIPELRCSVCKERLDSSAVEIC